MQFSDFADNAGKKERTTGWEADDSRQANITNMLSVYGRVVRR
jgi:hypothetical protein